MKKKKHRKRKILVTTISMSGTGYTVATFNNRGQCHGRPNPYKQSDQVPRVLADVLMKIGRKRVLHILETRLSQGVIIAIVHKAKKKKK